MAPLRQVLLSRCGGVRLYKLLCAQFKHFATSSFIFMVTRSSGPLSQVEMSGIELQISNGRIEGQNSDLESILCKPKENKSLSRVHTPAGITENVNRHRRPHLKGMRLNTIIMHDIFASTMLTNKNLWRYSVWIYVVKRALRLIVTASSFMPTGEPVE